MCFIIRGVIGVQQDVLRERERKKRLRKEEGLFFCGWEFCTLISGMLEDSEGKMWKNLDECGIFFFSGAQILFLLLILLVLCLSID